MKVWPCVGVSLGSLCMPSGFDGRAESEGNLSAFPPEVHWQLLPLWEVGLKLEGLQLDLDVSWGFS